MKRFMWVLVIVLVSSTACSRPDQRASADEVSGGTPTPGDWAIVRFEAEPDTLNPMTSSSSNATYVMYGLNQSNVYEELMQYDPTDWSFTKPLLAESYPEISDDHLTYTFTIREGVKWHDGRPFTVDDVLFSIKVTMTPSVDSAPTRGYFSDLTNVEVLDGRRIRFTFAKPNVLNVLNLGSVLSIVAKHVYDTDGVLDDLSYSDIIGPKGRSEALRKFGEAFNKHPANRAPIGTGPWKVERWDTAKELVLARNDDYWGAKPYLNKIVYRMITDYTAGLTALKSGDVDFNPRMTPIQLAQQTTGQQFDSQFKKTSYSIPQFTYIGWNMDRPYFKDKRVRQALTMLVNRSQILETVRFGLGTLTESPLSQGSAEYNRNLTPYPYDPQRAAQLLDEVGWKDSNGDGIRDKNGIPFRFELLISTANAIGDQLLPILKETFRQAGIEMTERRLEFTVFYDTLADHNFDAETAGWTSGLFTDPYQLWHSSAAQNRGSNYVSFKNAESDRLIEQARLEFDPEKRKEILWKWQEIIHEEQPYTFLWNNKEAAAWDKRFQNIVWYPPRPGYDLSTWFVPAAFQRYGAAKTD